MNLETYAKPGQQVYLASPYFDPDPAVRQARYEHVLTVTVKLANAGLFVFSPIVYCHELAKQFNLPKDFDYWKAFNASWLRWAEAFWIDCQDRWSFSVGVAGETAMALKQGMSATHYYLETNSVWEEANGRS